MLNESLLAIAVLLCPCAIKSKISSSRSVNSANSPGCFLLDDWLVDDAEKYWIMRWAMAGLKIASPLLALFTFYLINPIGEETGRVSQSRIFKSDSARGSLRSSSAWCGQSGICPVPGFFVPSEMGAFNPVNFVFFVLISIFVRIIWTWVTNHVRSSGIVAILLHASSNAVSLALIPNLLPAPTPDQMAISGLILLGLLSLLAVLLLIFARGRLSYQP